MAMAGSSAPKWGASEQPDNSRRFQIGTTRLVHHGDMTPTGGPHPHAQRRLADIDVRGVADALDDASPETQWWYDPATGRVEPTLADDLMLGLDDDEDQRELSWVLVDSPGSRAAYQDMVDFANAVGDPRASEILTRALEGRGAFRRFRDTLEQFDDMRHCWLGYTRAASEQRAIDWLVDENLVTGDDTDTERNARSANMSAGIADVAARRGQVVAEADLPGRWDEVSYLIDAGHAVTVTRDGQAWASITPFSGPDR